MTGLRNNDGFCVLLINPHLDTMQSQVHNLSQVLVRYGYWTHWKSLCIVLYHIVADNISFAINYNWTWTKDCLCRDQEHEKFNTKAKSETALYSLSRPRLKSRELHTYSLPALHKGWELTVIRLIAAKSSFQPRAETDAQLALILCQVEDVTSHLFDVVRRLDHTRCTAPTRSTECR